MAKQKWGSRFGIIMAVAGSAIGLGNFLRFPGQVAQNGGGAFMIPYFIALFLVGLPLMWIEWTIGRFGGGFGHSTAPGMFHSLWNKNRFIKYFGVIGIFGPIIIFVYYSYIESWLLGYSVFALLGKYDGCRDSAGMSAFLNGYRGLVHNEHFSGIHTAYLFFLITFAINIGILYLGIQGGIERACKWALPILFLCAILLMIRVFTLGTPDPAHPENSITAGLGYLWNPDWTRLADANVWLAAAGQIFFTLSVGIGVILTYASYLTPRDDVALSGLTATAANETAEVILGGSIVIPAAVALFGVAGATAAAQGGIFDLGFKTMPLVLQHLGAPHLFGLLWFGLLFLAGITSSISLAQPAMAFLEDEFDLTRKQACLAFGAVTFVLCHACIFGLRYGVVDEMDFWGGTFCLVLFGTVEAVLFAWVFGMDRAWTELHTGSDITIPRFYRFIIKYITPSLLILILGYWFWQSMLDTILFRDIGTADAASIPYRLATRLGLVALFAGIAWMVRRAWRKRAKKGAACS
jgi:NSS family neurotransmitter:Na+ symporter